MENMFNSCSDLYEVEKIINCKIYHNKKHYLIKWLCYPIKKSTWEPKSNLKHLKYMIREFEAEYPFSIDQNMYNIYCEEVNKNNRFKNRKKKFRKSSSDIKFTTKKRKIEYFSELELNDHYLDKLKVHLHINVDDNQEDDKKQSNDDFIIDLSSVRTQNEESIKNNSLSEQNLNIAQEKKDIPKLVKPKMN